LPKDESTLLGQQKMMAALMGGVKKTVVKEQHEIEFREQMSKVKRIQTKEE